MFTVPPIYLLIAKSPLVKDHFDTWDDASSGAAPMGQDLQLEVGRKLGKGATVVRQVWGLSETVWVLHYCPFAFPVHRSGPTLAFLSHPSSSNQDLNIGGADYLFL